MDKQIENLNKDNSNLHHKNDGEISMVNMPNKNVEQMNVMKRKVGVDILDLALKTDGAENGYKIILNNKFLRVDEQVNQRLMEAGLTNEQAQLVYNLAGEVLVPQINEIIEEFRALKELAKLESYFGGEEKFDEISRQISLWAEKNLTAEIYASLNSSFYGVIALYNMMNSGDPKVISKSMESFDMVSDKKLKEMMQDPRYWRDGDKDFIKQVEDGFQSLYGQK